MIPVRGDKPAWGTEQHGCNRLKPRVRHSLALGRPIENRPQVTNLPYISLLLASPWVYTSLMSVIGADSGMKRFVREYLRVRLGQRILDLGCGPGRLYPHLPQVEYCGLDADAGYLARARALYPNARFEQQDVSTGCPQFELRGFDLIVASGLLHHLSDAEVKRALTFCHDRLRTGGRLVTLDCAIEEGQGFLSRMLVASDRGRFVRRGRGYLELARVCFPGATLAIRHDLLRVPYCHAIVEGEKR
jgi:SAM-dependent methyltransferase